MLNPCEVGGKTSSHHINLIIMRHLVDLLSDKDNVAITGSKYIFPVKEYNEAGEFTKHSDTLGVVKLYQLVGKINQGKSFVNDEERYYSQIGKIKGLTALLRELADLDNGTIEGRLVVHEFIESEIPEEYEDMFFNSKDDDPKEKYRKKTGKDGEYLLSKGEQIFRFVLWVFDDTKNIYVKHDQ